MPRKKNKNTNPQVTEAVMLAIDATINSFINNEEAKEWEYPSCFTSIERAYIHLQAQKNGLKSKSRGTGEQRYLTIYKREGSAIVQRDATLSLTPAARTLLNGLFNKQPVSNRERQDCTPPLERSNKDSYQEGCRLLGRIVGGVSQVPPAATNKAFAQFRASLPIFAMRDTILHTVTDNQVTIISGPTGSGKTTQVPQYLLEWHERMSRPCRIIVTQPRRISAVSVSERVALERGEKLGHVTGYQIRLEGKTSPYTLLTFCTVGVLMRTLMSADGCLSNVTHVIVDEVHERDRLTDFLLLVLREALAKYRSLRLILMSATAHTKHLSNYFSNCPVISTTSAQKRMYEVKEYYLDDILKFTNYMNPEMERLKKDWNKRKVQAAELEKWKKASLSGDLNQIISTSKENNVATPGSYLDMDTSIREAWAYGTQSAFSQMLYIIQTDNVSVDYQHSETGLTALMVAVARGNLDAVENLLQLGASITMRAGNAATAFDLATDFNQPHILQLLKQQMLCEDQVDLHAEKQAEKDTELLDLYYSAFGYENIDMKLTTSLISCIHAEPNKGAILVFLPGYDDIMSLKEHLQQEEKKLNMKGKIMLMMLHSNMPTGDQKMIFKLPPAGTRKIILSTNIAETSVTIDDVVYVIDIGKVKEKMYNAMTGVGQLCTIWASKSCAEQRKGRAGRTQPGVCYRLYSRARHAAMAHHRTPEILHIPIPDLCLYAKLLAPPNTSIVDFLSKAIDPPSSISTRSAVSLLKTVDALDTWEDLTELGHHLLELPVDPKYGKMLIYGSLLKCLDPVLTIVCCLTYRDIFVLPTVAEKRKVTAEERQKFSAGSLSDHMTLLRVFQGWQEARRQGRDRVFCREHFVSGALMEMVFGTRAQVLAQLRASGFIRAKGPGDIKSVNVNSDNWAAVKAAIVAGLYPNIARLDRDHSVLRTQKEAKVGIHPSSVLRDTGKGKNATLQSLPTDWVVYEEMTRSGRSCFIRTATVVSPITIAVFAGPSKIPIDAFSDTQMDVSEESDSEEEEVNENLTAQIKLDDWLMFRLDSESAQLALQLRIKWHALVIKKLRYVHKLLSPMDDLVISTIVRVLSSEEQAARLKQPAGVGRRPYLVSSDPSNIGQNNRAEVGDHSQDQDKMLRPSSSPGKLNFERMNGKPFDGDNSNLSPLFGNMDINRTTSIGNGSQCRYFVIKAGQLKNIENSIVHKLWSFLPNTHTKLVLAYKSGKTVMLVFSMQGSRHWQGLARLAGDRTPESERGSYPGYLPVEWLRHGSIPYQATKHLTNPYSDNAKVQTSRDGQELEPSVGEALCKLWDSVGQWGWQPRQQNRQPNHMFHSNLKS